LIKRAKDDRAPWGSYFDDLAVDIVSFDYRYARTFRRGSRVARAALAPI
jgi:hypothetical protein